MLLLLVILLSVCNTLSTSSRNDFIVAMNDLWYPMMVMAKTLNTNDKNVTLMDYSTIY